MASDKTGSVLVVGAGIAGIQASLDLAEAGYYVYLLEKTPAIGGTMPMLDKTFPTNDCSMCILSPKLVECGRHLNIETITCAKLEDVAGKPGNFKVKIKQKARYIEIDKCKSCNECTENCPVTVGDRFNQNLSTRKAIYKPYAQAFPNAFVIEKNGISPCRAACPAGVNAQGYVQMIKTGNYLDAWEIIYKDNPFPAVCGRVCDHPCESKCHRGEIDEPVRIRQLKRFAADMAYKNIDDLPLPEITEKRSEKVAVVGSGPAGLSAAYQLVKRGYKVTVFEALPVAGGMMRVGIPDYRLPKKWVDLEINLLEKLGVEIKTGMPLGSKVTIDGLFKDGYKAVFLAVGAHQGAALKVKGEDLAGVVNGVTFLRSVALKKNVQIGKKVVVVGGGNVAMDVARTALRLGAEKVEVFCLEAKDEMPAFTEEIEEAKEEGIKINNSFGVKRILGKDGKVTGLEVIKCASVFDEKGNFNPQFVSGTEKKVEADYIILAIGQLADLSFAEKEKCQLSIKKGKIAANSKTLATNIPGVFAGGDAVTGPRTIVQAVAAGKRAAESIDRYLKGIDLLKDREFEVSEEDIAPLRFKKEEVAKRKAEIIKFVEPSKRKRSFEEVSLGFTEEQAKKEAERCLNCGICSECMQCVKSCKTEAINHSMKDKVLEVNVGSIILCPGFEAFDASKLEYYGYGKFPNVLTSLELERILSASGPFQGHLLRPYDKKEPRKIAWIQCVGSRNIKEDVGYCSSICCMYAIKEAIIAKEHSKEFLDTTIFFMDMRTYGKGFEQYYERARSKHGVRFVRSRIFSLEEVKDESRNIRIRYASEDGSIVVEDFDLVVLSVGLMPTPEAKDIAQKLGIKLNKYNFCELKELSSVKTSREGIYVAGAFSGPKDIPETVMQASAAAGEAETFLAEARHTLVKERKFPPERDVSKEEPRIGVFVCHCGINIGGVVDVPAVVEYARKLPYVVHAEDNLYTCSQDTQAAMREIIKEKQLNRVVVASCSPRTHRPLFQETMREAGLNGQLFEMANIRDQCSWVHQKEPEIATEKAKDLVKAAVYKAAQLQPIKRVTVGVTRTALVIGGGVSGMTSALSLAEQGYSVELVEKSPELGGIARRIKEGLNGEDVQKHLKQLIEQITGHPRIKVHTGSEVEEVSGYTGNFTSRLSTGEEIKHGVTIIATGGEEYRPQEYLYGEDERVVTQLELEEALAAEDEKVKSARNIVMIQCVGSRDEERPYCSRICCSKAVKLALKIKETNPEANIFILYRDIRTYGFMEEYYRQARSKGVIFIRYEEDAKPAVEKSGTNGQSKLEVTVKDHILGEPVVIDADLVVLAAAIVAPESNKKLSQLFKVSLNADNFFLEAHMKLRPVDFAADGVYMCGLAHGPKNLEENIAQAKAAAGRAATILSRDKLESGGVVAQVIPEKCAACLTCVRLCPFNAPRINPETNVAEIEPVQCQGCGTCAGECPNKAIQLLGYKDQQQMAQVEGLFAEVG